MTTLALALIPLALIVVGLAWYGARQTRTHAAMREHGHHVPLVEHTDTEEQP